MTTRAESATPMNKGAWGNSAGGGMIFKSGVGVGMRTVEVGSTVGTSVALGWTVGSTSITTESIFREVKNRPGSWLLVWVLGEATLRNQAIASAPPCVRVAACKPIPLVRVVLD